MREAFEAGATSLANRVGMYQEIKDAVARGECLLEYGDVEASAERTAPPSPREGAFASSVASWC